MFLAVHEHEKTTGVDAAVGNRFTFMLTTARHDFCWPRIVCSEALHFRICAAEGERGAMFPPNPCSRL